MVRQCDRDKKEFEKVSDGRRDIRQLQGQAKKAKDPERESEQGGLIHTYHHAKNHI